MITSPQERPLGCGYCFATLSPEDTDENFREFVRCQQCGKTYHRVCYSLVNFCLQCEKSDVESIDVPVPLPTPTILKTSAVIIKPSGITYSFDGLGFKQSGLVLPDSAGALLKQLTSLVRQLIRQIEQGLNNAFATQDNEYFEAIRQNSGRLAPIIALLVLCLLFYVIGWICQSILIAM